MGLSSKLAQTEWANPGRTSVGNDTNTLTLTVLDTCSVEEENLAWRGLNLWNVLSLQVHQEEWQRELLRKYGSDICLLDATYKTTRYDLALYFVAVRTNVGYSIVAEFIIQREQACHIAEALAMIRSWNKGWCPKFWMTDYSEAEQLAIEETFPGSMVYLCDFHREQAWGRWVRSHKSGLSKAEQLELLSDLRSLAWAEPGTAKGKPREYFYRVKEGILKESPLYKDNVRVRDWLDNKWLSCPEVCGACVTRIICYSSFGIYLAAGHGILCWSMEGKQEKGAALHQHRDTKNGGGGGFKSASRRCSNFFSSKPLRSKDLHIVKPIRKLFF